MFRQLYLKVRASIQRTPEPKLSIDLPLNLEAFIKQQYEIAVDQAIKDIEFEKATRRSDLRFY